MCRCLLMIDLHVLVPVASSLITLKKTNAGGDGAELRLINSSTTVETATQIVFTNTTTDSTNAAVIKVARTAGGQDFRFASDGTERLRILSSGGITFNGDTAAANALDDYEEGTFTPTLFGSTTAGTTTYGVQRGAYIKIGSQVTCFVNVSASATTGTGPIVFGNLPFTSINDVNFQSVAPVMVTLYNWSGGSYLQVYKSINSTVANLYGLSDDAGWLQQDMTNEIQEFIFTVSYRTT